MSHSVKVAIEGCCHGELNSIYRSLPTDTEILIICGDFQAFRAEIDLQTASIPRKYQKLGDFHEYYHGIKKAPILTIFIGGNHECSSYLQELKYGGWVAPNIYFLGEFGSVWFKGLQISGISGIFNHDSFINNLKDEQLPYNNSTLRSVYHTKPKTFLKNCLMNHNIDIQLSHDWPLNIYNHGNLTKLLQQKKFFKSDIENNSLGSPLNEFLLHFIRPRFWFSAHLHVKFTAKVEHKRKNDDKTGEMIEIDREKKNPEEIDINMDEDEKETKKRNIHETRGVNERNIYETTSVYEKNIIKRNNLKRDNNKRGSEERDININGAEAKRTSSKSPNQDTIYENTIYHNTETYNKSRGGQESTEFLALDKCLPRRKFLEIREIEVQERNRGHVSMQGGLWYSKRAIAVNKVVEEYLGKGGILSTNFEEVVANPLKMKVIDELLIEVHREVENLHAKNDQVFKIPLNFTKIVRFDEQELKYWPNEQTEIYCQKFKIKMLA